VKKHKTIKRLEKELSPPKEFKAKVIDSEHGIYSDLDTGEVFTPEQVEQFEKSGEYDLVIICNWDPPEDEEDEGEN
jgi:hypothetical protein